MFAHFEPHKKGEPPPRHSRAPPKKMLCCHWAPWTRLNRAEEKNVSLSVGKIDELSLSLARSMYPTEHVTDQCSTLKTAEQQPLQLLQLFILTYLDHWPTCASFPPWLNGLCTFAEHRKSWAFAESRYPSLLSSHQPRVRSDAASRLRHTGGCRLPKT